MVDVLGHEIHTGDRVLRARTEKDRGVIWSIQNVIGFTPKMVKIDVPNTYTRQNYSLVCPYNCLVLNENERLWSEREDEKCRLI